MVYTQETVDIQRYFIDKDVTSEAIDGLCEFLMEPFQNVWNSNVQINTGVTFGWMTSSILEVLPNAVKNEWLSQTQADEIAQCFTGDDVELTYLVCLDAPILFSSLLP